MDFSIREIAAHFGLAIGAVSGVAKRVRLKAKALYRSNLLACKVLSVLSRTSPSKSRSGKLRHLAVPSPNRTLTYSPRVR